MLISLVNKSKVYSGSAVLGGHKERYRAAMYFLFYFFVWRDTAAGQRRKRKKYVDKSKING